MNKYYGQIFRSNKNYAFTIVELLVVIVVIGILAAITVVSYSGIQAKAITVGLINDLDSDAKLLKMYNVEHGYYPDSISTIYCPDAPIPDNRYCLKASSGNTLSYTGGGQVFTLTATHTSGVSYQVTQDSSPVAIANEGGGSETSDSFIKSWGSDQEDGAADIAATPDGGYVIVGNSRGFEAEGYTDAFITKFHSDGTVNWSKTWGGDYEDSATRVLVNSDGSIVICGNTTSFWTDDYDNGNAFIAKFSTEGNLLWDDVWGKPINDDSAWGLVRLNDGSYIISGYTQFGSGTINAFAVKYTSSGVYSWNKTWGGTWGEYGYAITTTSDGGFAISGDSLSYVNDPDSDNAFIAKFNSSGILQWDHIWGNENYDVGHEIMQVDGGIIVGGSTGTGGDNSALITKFSNDGDLLWNKTINDEGGDTATNIIPTSDGGFIVSGDTELIDEETDDKISDTLWMSKFSANGVLNWYKKFDYAGYYTYLSGVAEISGGGYYLAATSQSIEDGFSSSDVLMMKINPNGTIHNCSAQMCQSINPVVQDLSYSYYSTNSGLVATPQNPFLADPSATVRIINGTINTIIEP